MKNYFSKTCLKQIKYSSFFNINNFAFKNIYSKNVTQMTNIVSKQFIINNKNNDKKITSKEKIINSDKKLNKSSFINPQPDKSEIKKGTIMFKKENIENKAIYDKIGNYIELVKRPNLERLESQILSDILKNSTKENKPNDMEFKIYFEQKKLERINEVKNYILQLIDSDEEASQELSLIFSDQILNRNFKLLIKIIIDNFDLFTKLRVSMAFLKYNKQHESLFDSLLSGLIEELICIKNMSDNENINDKSLYIEKMLLIEKTLKILNKHNISREKIDFEKINALISVLGQAIDNFYLFYIDRPLNFFSIFEQFSIFESDTLKIKDEFIFKTNAIYFKLTRFTMKNIGKFSIDNLMKVMDFANRNKHRDSQFYIKIFLFIINYMRGNPGILNNQKLISFLKYFMFLLINNNMFFDSRLSEFDLYDKVNYTPDKAIKEDMKGLFKNQKLTALSNEKVEAGEIIAQKELFKFFYPHLLIQEYENTIFFIEAVINIWFEESKRDNNNNISNNSKNTNIENFNTLRSLCFLHDGFMKNFFKDGKIKSEEKNNISKFKNFYLKLYGADFKKHIKENEPLYNFLLGENKILQILKDDNNKNKILRLMNLIEETIKNKLISSNFKDNLERISKSQLNENSTVEKKTIDEIKSLRNFIYCVNYMKSINNFFGFDSKKIFNCLKHFDKDLLESGTITNFHKEFIKILQRMNKKFVIEGFSDDISKDIEIIDNDKNLKICIELDGYYHFYRDSTMNYKTIFKRRILENLGWKIIMFRYSDWIEVKSEEDKYNLVKKKLDFIYGNIEYL